MADVKVTVRKNASYMIEGPITVVDPEGNTFTLGEGPVFLCRCGHSGNKPFCDGSHKREGFNADTRASVKEPGQS